MNNYHILEFTNINNGSKFYITQSGNFFTPDLPGTEKTVNEMLELNQWFISSFRRMDGELFNAGDLVYGHYQGVGGKAYYTKENPGKIVKFLFSAGGFYANFGDAYVIDYKNLIKL